MVEAARGGDVGRGAAADNARGLGDAGGQEGGDEGAGEGAGEGTGEGVVVQASRASSLHKNT